MRFVPFDVPIDYRKARDFLSGHYGVPEIHPRAFDYLEPEYYLLFEDADMRRIADAVRAVNRIFVKAYAFTMERFAERCPKFVPLAEFFPPAFDPSTYFVGRYDILVEKGTLELKFLETNANTPGFVNEPYHVSRLFLPEGRGWAGAGLRERVRKAFAPYAGKTLGILLSHSFSDEDYLIACDYRDMLEGIFPKEDVVIADIFESQLAFDEEFLMKGRKVDAVLNFFPLEFFFEDPDFAIPFFDSANRGRFAMKNPLSSMILQDKGIFATVWEEIDRFSPEERTLVERHIPFTTRSMPESSEGWIAKWRFGRMGREIYTESFSANVDRPADFIYQQRIESEPVDETGRSLVLGVWTDFTDPISFAVRRQKKMTTDDDDSDVVLSYCEKSVTF